MSRGALQRIVDGWRSEIRDSVRLGAANALAALLSFTYSALAGRWLPAVEFATLGSALAALYLATVLVTPATGAVAQLFAEARARGSTDQLRAILRVASKRSALWAAALVAACALAASWLSTLAGWEDPGAVVGAAAAAAALMVLAPVRGALRGLDRLAGFGASLVLEAALRLLLGIALLLLWPRASVALGAYALAALIAALAAGRALDLPAGAPASDWTARLRGAATGFLTVQLVVAGFHNVDMLIVRRLASDADAALYAAALTVARVIGFLGVPFAILVVPRAAAAAGRGESPLAPALRLSALFAIAAAPFVALCAAMPSSIVGTVMGPSYSAAGSILARLAPAFLIGGVNALLAQALVVRGRWSFLVPLVALLGGLILALALYRGPLAGYADRVLAAHALACLVLLAWARFSRQPTRHPPQ